ncbi:MAG: hypothetical protein M0T85_10630 [Dehalococcoidales bacterium]|nr:hypothetical protein [Dehalococcoidales bacterium]
MSTDHEPSGLDNIVVRPIYLRAVNAIVQPEIQLPCSLYFFQKWLPRLGALRWALVLALRSACNQRLPDGTNRGDICRADLARMLGVHEATISRILTTAPSSIHRGWRVLQPLTNDDHETAWLSKFVPRLRYKYERDAEAGVTRRVGYIIDVVIDDPLIPEDEERLAVILAEQVLQSLPGSHPVKEEPTPSQSDETQVAALAPSHRPSPRAGRSTRKAMPQTVKSQHAVSHLSMTAQNALHTSNVQQQRASSQQGVNQHKASYNALLAQDGSVLTLTSNYIYRDITIDLTLARKRDIRAAVTPLVEYAAQTLNDHHSKGMFFSTLTQLYPEHLEVFTAALEVAERQGQIDDGVNMGAVFVNTIRELAAEGQIQLELGKKSKAEATREEQTSLVEEATAEDADGGNISIQGTYLPGTRVSVKQLWPSVLQELRALTSKANYEMWLRHCTVLGVNGDVVVVGVPSAFARDWINERLLGIIRKGVYQVIGQDVPVRCEVQPSATPATRRRE